MSVFVSIGGGEGPSWGFELDKSGAAETRALSGHDARSERQAVQMAMREALCDNGSVRIVRKR